MTRRTGAGRAAVLVAALLPAACTQTLTLQPPSGATGGQGGNSAVNDAGSLGDSSSGSDHEGGSGHDPGCTPGSSFTVLNNNVHRTFPAIVIALDHSNSMNAHFGNGNGTKLSVVENALADSLIKFGPMVRFGYVEFPGLQQRGGCNNMNGCCIGTPIKPVSETENGILALMAQCAAGQPTGMGTGCINTDAIPTATALAAINETYTSLGTGAPNPSWPRYTLLITGGEPSCAMSMTGGDACDQAATEAAKLNIMGIPTYVVAVGDIPGPSDANGFNICMNQIANLSGIVRSNTSPFYYPTAAEDKLTSTLTTIITLASCHLEIDDNGFTDPNLTQISLPNAMGVTTTIAHDPTRTNGWEFERTPGTRIALYGTACTDFVNAFLPSGSLTKVRVQACTSSSHP